MVPGLLPLLHALAFCILGPATPAQGLGQWELASNRHAEVRICHLQYGRYMKH